MTRRGGTSATGVITVVDLLLSQEGGETWDLDEATVIYPNSKH